MAARRGRPQLPRTEVPRPFGGADWLALTQEPALEPEISICDPHHHFWDFRTDRMPYQCYLLHELADDIHSGHNVRATVFIEARSMYCPDGPEKLAGRLKGPAVRELLLLIGDKF